jgi:carotenoid cleavage dioxygenase-like enzyme
LCYTDLRGSLPRGFSAHPKTDPVTGELHAVAYRPTRRTVDHVVVGTDGVVTKVNPLQLDGRPLLHDIALTENYLLVFDLSIQFRIRTALTGLAFSWDHGHVPRIGVVSRKDSTIRWFEVDPYYVVHTTNAYEDGTTIVFEGTRYDHRPGEHFGVPPRAHTHPWRWRIDLAGGSVHAEQLSDIYEEFPRINESLLSRANRYSYTTMWPSALAKNDPCGLVKRDALTGRTEIRHYPPGQSPGEPVFVPRQGAIAEDDGWLFTFVTDLPRDRTDLVLLDARSITSEPVAVVHLPVRVPLGFHSNWIPDH